MMKFAIAGASGRMGRILIETVLDTKGAELVGALDRENSPTLGTDPTAFLGKNSATRITADISTALTNADFLIDFTRPEATMAYVEEAVRKNVKLIIGTTGLTPEQQEKLRQASKQIAIVFAPNMSVGVNATFKLLEIAAHILNTGYDIEVFEAHHRHKIDAPSGTALRMGEILAQAKGKTLADCAVYSRVGNTGERQTDTIGFSVVRGGDIIGDHTVTFAGLGERIEISHRSSSRASYAQGALRAAQFLQQHTTGFFDMQDVLGLR